MSHRLHFDAANAALSVEPGLARLRHRQDRARQRLASRQAGDHYDPNLQLLRAHERAQSLPRLLAERALRPAPPVEHRRVSQPPRAPRTPAPPRLPRCPPPPAPPPPPPPPPT